MNREEQIRQKIGRDHGFRTPPGDFLDPVYKDLLRRLPERKPLPPVNLSLWQRVRPYVYLAAMFAGLWCTMKIISQMHLARQTEVSLDNPPALVAQAVATPEVVEQLNIPQQASDVAIVGDAAEQFESIEEFEEAFDYEFDPQIENLDISELQQELATDSGEEDGSGIESYEDIYYDYYASI